MAINLGIPETQKLKPQIIVFGVGGAGGNAVNNMIRTKLGGVDFVCANTDAQALTQALTERRVQLGAAYTQGLGAGSRPEVGRAAAEETLDELISHLQGSNMCFIAAGMGGGTGTGGAPVVARAARELGILTVGVVTKPFHFEGTQRMRIAEEGIAELQQYVDTLIVIPNQNLFRVANDKTTFADAFRMADDVLSAGVRGVTDLMVQPGLINLDFADVRTVMSEMGKAMMGTGEATGDRRAIEAAEAAISNPLLDDVSMKGARGVLINITGGGDMTLFEVDEAANRIREEVDPDANIIFGATFDEGMEGRMRISLVATGIEVAATAQSPYKAAKAGGQPMRPVLVKTDAAPAAEAPSSAPAAAVAHRVLAEPAGFGLRTTMMPASHGQHALAIQDVELEPAPAMPAMAAAAPQPVYTPAPVEPAPVAVHAPAVAAQPQPAPAETAPAPAPMPAPAPAARDAFIPPRPVEPRKPAAQQAPAAPARAAEPAEEQRRRMPSLFARMTDTMKAAIERPQAAPATPAVQPQAQAARPAAARPAAEPAAQPKASPDLALGRPQATDRLGMSSTYEDVLDIPAFLRRQAN